MERTLFVNGTLSSYLNQRLNSVLQEIDRYDPDQLLLQSQDDVVAFLVSKFIEDAPELDLDNRYVDGTEEVQIDVSGDPTRSFGALGPTVVSGTQVRIVIPFKGNGRLLDLTSNNLGMNPPIADTTQSAIVLLYRAPQLNAEQLRMQMDRDIANLVKYVGWTHDEVTNWNSRLHSEVVGAISRRKTRLLHDRNLGAC